MIKTLYDPRVMEKGIRKGKREGKLEVAQRLLEKGLMISDVAEVTDLPIEEIRKLQR